MPRNGMVLRGRRRTNYAEGMIEERFARDQDVQLLVDVEFFKDGEDRDRIGG